MRSPRLSHLLFSALALAAVLGRAGAAPPPAANAVVRIPSHGASATVIETGPGYTLLLGCAHAFEGPDRTKPIQLDVPVPAAGQPKQARIRLVAVDYQADLSLLVLEDGPVPFVLPVAAAGHRPSAAIWSAGYDEMRWPATAAPATIIALSPSTTYTRERPWHGRSGGALIDVEAGRLIGVVQGYETAGPRRGMYVAHAEILRFLNRKQPPPQPPALRPLCPT